MLRALSLCLGLGLACGDDATPLDASPDAERADGGTLDARVLDASEAADSSVDAALDTRPPDPADWATRSGGDAVTMATNFEASADVFDFARDDPSNYEWERTIRRSGEGALKILIRPEDGTSGWDWWRFLDDSTEPFGSAESGLRDEYWLTYSVYVPQSYYDWVFRCAGSKKFSITSSHPSDSVHPVTRERIQFPISDERRTGSSVPNEVVIDDTKQTMWVTLYRQANGRSAEQMNSFAGVGCSRFDFAWTSGIDLGVQTGTPMAFEGDVRDEACRNWNAQFGPSYLYGQMNGGPTQGARRDAPGQVPHPDPIAAGAHFEPGWNTIMYHLRFPTTWEGSEGGVIELWIHHEGDDDWSKIFERRDDFVMNDPGAVENGIELNGGVDGYFHWGLWLTPFRTGGEPEPERPSTFLVYDEVIVSTQPIPAPES